MNKQKRKKSGFLTWIILLLLIGMAEYGGLYYYEYMIDTGNNILKNLTNNTPSGVRVLDQLQSENVNQNLIDVTQDKQLYAYVDKSNVLHVYDMNLKQKINDLHLNHTISYIKWINDSSLFVGTESQSGSTKTLRLATVNISSGTVKTIHTFTGFTQTSGIETVTFSPNTNDVYVLIGNNKGSNVYHFDTMSQMYPYRFGGRLVTDLLVTSTTDQLYYQDLASGRPDVLVFDYKTQQSKVVERNAVLLQIIENKAYYGKTDENGKVTEVDSYENGTSQSVRTLNLPVAKDKIFISQNGDVLVSGDTGYSINGEKDVTIQNIKSSRTTNDAMYFTLTDGTTAIAK